MTGAAVTENLLRLGALACDWPAPPRVRAWVTTRRNGFSVPPYDAGRGSGQASVLGGALGSDLGSASGNGLNLGMRCGDVPATVKRNRERLVTALGAPVHWLNQVHGTAVELFGGDQPSRAQQAIDEPVEEPVAEPVADAAVTATTGLVLGVLSADCLPIFLCAADGSAVAICHAGWRGLAAGVEAASLRRLRDCGATAGDELAHLGPAIGRGFFEVGVDVLEAFCDQDPQARSAFSDLPGQRTFRADLYALAAQGLRRLGVSRISGGRFCTYRDQELFYSHRRDRISGRMASLIWIEA